MADDQTPEEPNDEFEHEGTGLADHKLTARRLEKIQQLSGEGVDPYPVGFHRTHMALALHDRFINLEPGATTGEEVTVAGRIVLMRSFGKLVFATLQDGSGRIQVMAQKDQLEDRLVEFEKFDVGDFVGVSGEVITTRKGELSVRVRDFALLAKGLRPLPEKWHGLGDVETRSRRRYLDLIVNPDAREVAITRSEIVSSLRRQFEERGFVEVETPVLLAQAGGALARPFETHHNALDMPMFLRIATELPLKMLIVGGVEKVFEIGRIFRNEGIDGTHNPEFTTLESYEAYVDYYDVMEMVEEMLARIADEVHGSARFEYQGRTIDLSPPYRRARMVDLVAEAVGAPVWPPPDGLASMARGHGVEIEPSWGPGKIVEAMFDELVEHTIWDPVFVLDHPVEVSPLARRHRTNEGLTERFELFIAGAEYGNAFSELNDPIDQRERFVAQAAAKTAGDEEAHVIDESFLRALEYGMPPTGGLGLGIDRIVMLMTDKRHIRDVILFPTMRPE